MARLRTVREPPRRRPFVRDAREADVARRGLRTDSALHAVHRGATEARARPRLAFEHPRPLGQRAQLHQRRSVPGITPLRSRHGSHGRGRAWYFSATPVSFRTRASRTRSPPDAIGLWSSSNTIRCARPRNCCSTVCPVHRRRRLDTSTTRNSSASSLASFSPPPIPLWRAWTFILRCSSSGRPKSALSASILRFHYHFMTDVPSMPDGPSGGQMRFVRRTMLPAVLAALSVGVSPAFASPIAWDAGTGHNNHFYDVILSPTPISWDDAAAGATALGGYLATILSAEENNFVFGLVDSPAYWAFEAAGIERQPRSVARRIPGAGRFGAGGRLDLGAWRRRLRFHGVDRRRAQQRPWSAWSAGIRTAFLQLRWAGQHLERLSGELQRSVYLSWSDCLRRRVRHGRERDSSRAGFDDPGWDGCRARGSSSPAPQGRVGLEMEEPVFRPAQRRRL